MGWGEGGVRGRGGWAGVLARCTEKGGNVIMWRIWQRVQGGPHHSGSG